MIFDKLDEIWANDKSPFLISSNENLTYSEIKKKRVADISKVNTGDVVALVGDFNENSIATFLQLLEKKCIVVPLTKDTINQHSYFLSQSHAQHLFYEDRLVESYIEVDAKHPLIDKLKGKGHPGLILFTSGSTGKPKAILHDFTAFINRYSTPRASLKSLSFLLFDHIGGINTLLHMLFNRGLICSITERSVPNMLKICAEHEIELLPATPTFLRMLLLVPNLENLFPKSIKIISYGTERMDQTTLTKLTKVLPDVDFRQTYGMSELGILRIKSLARDSLFMKIGGEGIETKILDNVLYIKASNRMIGYLNASSPFDDDGWYCTKDIVETNIKYPEYIKIVGRDSETINVAGLKFMASDVESILLDYPNIKLAKAVGKENPITGQHVEVFIEVDDILGSKSFDIKEFKIYLSKALPRHMRPLVIKVNEGITVSHRLKRL